MMLGRRTQEKESTSVEGRRAASLSKALPLLGLLVFSAGCVERTILIETNPPGAAVWINETKAGITPLTHEFITHGRYKFRLTKNGFRELVVREKVRAPIYQWIPIDFIAEYLVPIPFKDRHLFRYNLSPLPPEERLKITEDRDLQGELRAFKSPEPKVRREACIALAKRRDPTTAPFALKATADPEPSVRIAGLEALRAIQGIQAMDRLLDALHLDPSPEVRWQAAMELEALANRKSVPDLIRALQSDKDPLVRTGAAEALKEIPDPLSVRPLMKALKDGDTAVRRAATEGLGKIGDPAAIPSLSRVLFHHDVRTRRKAVEALARFRDPATGPTFVRTFTDWDPTIRRRAVQALVEFGDARVVLVLIRRLRGLRPWTREHAAQVLAALKDPRSVKPLKRAYKRESDPPAKEAMAAALKAMGQKL